MSDMVAAQSLPFYIKVQALDMFIMSAPARRSLAPFHCKSLVKGTRFREKVALTSEFRMSAALLNQIHLH